MVLMVFFLMRHLVSTFINRGKSIAGDISSWYHRSGSSRTP
jgi:hypothetical protein